MMRVGKRSHVLEDMLREYLPILVFLAIAIGLGLVLILAAVIIAVRNPVFKVLAVVPGLLIVFIRLFIE